MRRILFTIQIVLVISLACSACSDSSSLPDFQDDDVTSHIQGAGELVSFEGSVFVAITKPDNILWLSAGWQIAGQPVAGDQDSVPADCTLYPHKGVDDQWIGSCSGKTYIPRAGANHIAVMHTRPDGTTKMVQVAPPPVAGEP
jgi:hypothetical protein